MPKRTESFEASKESKEKKKGELILEDKGEVKETKETQEKIPLPEEYFKILKENSSEKHAEAYKKVIDIAQAIKEAGGQALLVGGSVRDMILGKISKDFDIEVYGLEAAKVEEIVSRFGKVSDVGRAFGILKMTLGEGVDIDVSLPRVDSKIGEGHRGFEVKTDPRMSIKEAARRRDFTMNSAAADPLTGEVYDPFGGRQDLRSRVLRVTDGERFRDDSLRMMRALQFIGRFGLSLDPESARIIQEMTPELKELPKERIFEEWKKLLLKSEKPSLGLAAGMSLGVLREIHPEFPPLAETPQEPEWHPEGDAWIHSLMVVDKAAEIIRREDLDNKEALVIMLASLCHDLGKAAVTQLDEKGRYISHGHEEASQDPSLKFLDSIGVDNLTRDKVVKLVVNHLKPTLLYTSEVIQKQKISDGVIRRLAQRISPATIRELALVGEADHLGRGPFEDPEIPEQLLLSFGYSPGKWLLRRARAIEVEDSKPTSLTRGKDWLVLGYRPGTHIGKLITLADQLRDEKDYTREQVFQAVYGISDAQEAVKKLEGLLENKNN